MKKNFNPKQYQLIKEFVDYIENEGKSSGYLLMNKGNFKSNSMFFREIPKRGDKTTINLRFQQERISDDDLDLQIERFLRTRNGV